MAAQVRKWPGSSLTRNFFLLLAVHLDGHGGNYWVVSVNDTGTQYDDAIVWSCEAVIFKLEWVRGPLCVPLPGLC